MNRLSFETNDGTFSGVIPIKKINDKKFKIKKENITYKIINLYKELINSK